MSATGSMFLRRHHLPRCFLRSLRRDFSKSTMLCTPRGTGGFQPPEEPACLNSTDSVLVGHQSSPRPAQLRRTDFSQPAVDLSKSLPEKPLGEGSREAKDLYKALVHSSPERVLHMISTQHEKMNKIHYALAMKTLFRFVLGLAKEDQKAFQLELQQEEGFQLLVALVALKGKYYDATVAADMLRFLCILGLDSDHPALQVYLQLIKYHLNDLDLPVLVRLVTSLSSLAVTSQTQLLQSAIRVLVNIRAKEIPSLNQWQLISLLEHCGGALNIPVLLSTLAHILDSEEPISTRLAAAILRGLAKVDTDTLKDPEISNAAIEISILCIGRVHGMISEMSLRELVEIMTSVGKLGIYDVDLYNDVGQQFVHGDSRAIGDILFILGLFKEQRFRHADLLSTFKTRLVRHGADDLHNESDIKQVIQILAEMSTPAEVVNPESRPRDEQDLIKSLATRLTRESFEPASEADGILLDMAVLGLNISEHLKCSRVEPYGTTLLRLCHVLLENQLSLCKYRQTGLKTMGHVLKMAVGSQSVPVVPQDHPVSLLADFLLSAVAKTNQQDIAVKMLHDDSYHRNTGQLRGRELLYGCLLQQDGYQVMFINYDEWWRMEERDRVPYLSRRIKHVHLEQNLIIL